MNPSSPHPKRRTQTLIGQMVQSLKRSADLIRLCHKIHCDGLGDEIDGYIAPADVDGFALKCIIFWDTLHRLNRRAELRRLVRWARHKKLQGPERAYLHRLSKASYQLHGRSLRYQGAYRWSRLLFLISRLVSHAPRYRGKGAASAYRR